MIIKWSAYEMPGVWIRTIVEEWKRSHQNSGGCVEGMEERMSEDQISNLIARKNGIP